MSITNTIHDTIHAWIQLATGLDAANIIPDKENSPEPRGDHFVINSSLAEVGIGFRDELQYTSSGEYTVKGHRERSVSLHSYGVDAYALMQKVKMSQSAPSVRRIFKDAGLELIETRNVRDLSGLKGSRTETRAQMDLRVRYAQQFTDAVETTKQIDYEIRVSGDTITDSVSGT